ncbi:hypothetical protein P9112_005836 [Eukaryota sp. TZLM1-RC]
MSYRDYRGGGRGGRDDFRGRGRGGRGRGDFRGGRGGGGGPRGPRAPSRISVDELTGNCFNLELKPDCTIFEYSITFPESVTNPEARNRVQSQILRQAFPREENATIPRDILFDGSRYYSNADHPQLCREFEVEQRGRAGEIAKITVSVDRGTPIEFGSLVDTDIERAQSALNAILNRSLEAASTLKKFDRGFFDTKNPIEHPKDRELQVIRGFKTSIRAIPSPDGIQWILMVDIRHKPFANSVLDYIKETVQSAGGYDSEGKVPESVRGKIVKKLRGLSCMTKHNNFTFVIDRVLFNVRPTDKLDKREEKTFQEYFQEKYRVDLDPNQPMIQERSKRGGRRPALYPPQLCLISSLPDQFRDVITRVASMNPNDYHQHVSTFINILKTSNKENGITSERILEQYGVSVQPDLLKVPTTQLEPFNVQIRQHQDLHLDQKMKFERELRDLEVRQTQSLDRWAILYHSRAERFFNDFINTFRETAMKLMSSSDDRNAHLERPLEIRVDSRPGSLSIKLGELLSSHPGLKFALVIGEDDRAENYRDVKNFATRNGIATQYINSRKHSSKIHGPFGKILASNIFCAAECKLGAKLWTTSMPVDIFGAQNQNCVLMAGLAVERPFTGPAGQGGEARKPSTYSLVTMAFNPQPGAPFMTYSCHRQVSEAAFRADELETENPLMSMMEETLQYFSSQQTSPPTQIFIFRGGMSSSEQATVETREVEPIKDVIKNKYLNGLDVKIFFAGVSDVSSARFLANAEGRYWNAPPGSFVDSHVCDGIKEKDSSIFGEFYSITMPCHATARPVHYRILYNDFDANILSKRVLYETIFASTGLYYNFTGSVKVPAPLRYAQKLGQLVTLHAEDPQKGLETSANLNTSLFYM